VKNQPIKKQRIPRNNFIPKSNQLVIKEKEKIMPAGKAQPKGEKPANKETKNPKK